MKRTNWMWLWLPLVVLMSACASLSLNYEKPQVSITSFSLAPYKAGLTPRFEIGIQVINPNSVALPFRGMSYAVEIEGLRVLSGATSDIPTVPAYGQVSFKIDASPDLLNSARLLGELLSNQQRSHVNYGFNARLDAGRLLPMIEIKEAGELKLAP